MIAQPSITFKLGFGEPLISGGFMGKISMLPFVVQYVSRLVARNAFLDVEDLAAFVPGILRIANGPVTKWHGAKLAGGTRGGSTSRESSLRRSRLISTPKSTLGKRTY